ncbi:transcription initiation factor TFIID subunit 9B-like [Homarus americanus]|uniref:transcription initiation factor TFIID subunit 9B-like n=1 Tax=Homarus americanus TaxID=6706 RepID=UPI001C44A4D1|nr:transcription initiation factor TFIID subunit 9B-like [Homarus americanus]
MAKEPKVAVPKEAQVMSAILKDMGITDYEPGVINQMLEFTYRYVSQILDDARVYANYAKKIKTIEMDDVKLAVHMQMEKSFTTPPPRDLLLDLARTRNAYPLPAIKANQQGIRLPPDRYCLSACNYRLKPSRKKISSLSSSLGGGNRISLGGAGAGMKIAATPIKPTISMVTTKTGNNQTVTLVQKPATGIPSGPTQKIVSVNRPVFKVTPGPPGGSTPKIQLSAGNSGLPGNVMVNVTSASSVKMETDSSSFKRKREDEDYDSFQ